jgi:site-specific DNA-methyltransferase (adenine-specific)
VKTTQPVTSRPGDLWELGPHRLVVGDATAPATWEALCAGQDQPAAVWTDPPYGVAYVGGTEDQLTILNDDLDHDQLEKLLRSAFRNALEHTKPAATWWVASPSGPSMMPFAKVLGELQIWRQILVWVKDQLVLGHADYHAKHELMFWGATTGTWVPDATVERTEHELLVYGWSPDGPHTPPADRKQTSVLEFPRPKASKDHPTMKPPELIEYCLEHSKPGPVVDPFAGSGSTMVAAHRNGRRALLIELDPQYADVICRRWQEMTGEHPVRAGQLIDFQNDESPPPDPDPSGGLSAGGN